MVVNLKKPKNEDLHTIAGIQLGTAIAEIKNKGQRDLLIISLPEGSVVAGVFTKNQFCAAPVIVAQENIKQTNKTRALIVNTGFANAGTGEIGIKDARDICKSLAFKLKIKPHEVLPFSTGVIMEPLPVKKIQKKISEAVEDLNENNWQLAAEAIMTTDTIPKAISRQVTIQGQIINITGISKGSGMIHPNMATMLAFIGMNANISSKMLNQLIQEVTKESFNCISVDGDTSTNDSFIMMSTNQADHSQINLDNKDYYALKSVMLDVAINLAQAIVRDGEGATKFITIKICEALNYTEAKKIAMTIACSLLVKTAFFASDANLGRILSAIGNGEAEGLDIKNINIYLNDLLFAEAGALAASYNADSAQLEMKKSEIELRVMLGRGDGSVTIWTSDLSYDYVKINAEYRT